MTAERLTPQALNRALLARQGLLERHTGPLTTVVEAIGALQAQHWPALPVALWSRAQDFAPADLHGALQRGELVCGTLLRATLHLVSAREHPAYAAAVAAAGSDSWPRTRGQDAAAAGPLRAALLDELRDAPRSGNDAAALIEDWVAAHPGAIGPEELAQQRKHGWRAFLRWSSLVRAPLDARWDRRAPTGLRAAPGAMRQPTAERALAEVLRRHLRAFGPAAAEDVASWIGARVTPVRAALRELAPELLSFEDEQGRTLYDLPDAPRPNEQTPMPPRLLAPFDSVLLAYASGQRARILPDAYKDAVYERANLRIRPTFLLDGLVAGTWSVETRRRETTLTLCPLRRLARAQRSGLVEESERLLRVLYPDARAHHVAVQRGS